MSEPPRPNAEIDIAVAHAPWSATVAHVEDTVRAAVSAALAHAPVAGTVSVLLADDARLRDLNHRFRGVDRPTNVLAFPAAPAGAPDAGFLGDIAVAFETCRREAADQHKTLADHLAHLVVHGTLHLLGHDHTDDAEAAAMETLERTTLARLGIADPYQASATVPGGV